MIDGRNGFEAALATLVLGPFALFAVVFDGTVLWEGWSRGPTEAARVAAAVALGWILGWYLTCRFEPTHRMLVDGLLALAGYAVALVVAVATFTAMALLDAIGADPDRAGHLAVTGVTFAPVCSWFAMRLDVSRSAHLVAGLGVGAFGYVVLFGIPD